jgi:MinD superfamily P-loop ATPase
MMNNDKAVHAIYWVDGSKGGVGKSMMTIATVDYLLERGKNVLLVECDTSNPDVWNAYQNELECELVELNEADGWIDFVNMCDQHRESDCGQHRGAKQYGRPAARPHA